MKKRITIIEDNSRIRESLAALIENTDQYCMAGHYGNGEDAIKNLDQDQPDVVLMDIGLPGINGIECTYRIKKQRPDTIVLIITVLEDSDKVFQSLCAGAGGYIVKNSDTEIIIKSIEEALAGGAPMSLQIARMVVQSFKAQSDSPLSERERQVLQGVAQGKSYPKIARELFVSTETVRSHIKNIYGKLAVNNKSEALRIAGDNKWINRW